MSEDDRRRHAAQGAARGPGGPEKFYLSLGFAHTGLKDEDEIVLRLPLRLD